MHRSEFFNLFRGGLAHARFESCNLSIMSRFHGTYLFFVVCFHLTSSLALICLQSLNLLFKVCDDFSLILHHFLLFVTELLFKIDYLLFKLIDAFLKLHLKEFFVTAGVVFELVKHALVLIFELLQL